MGRRIEFRRTQRRLSRRAVANLVGRSEEWLRLIESGRLRLDSIEATIRLAEVLQIADFRELIDRPVPPERPTPAAAELVSALRPAILDHPGLADAMAATDMPATDWPAELLRCEQLWSRSRDRFTQTARFLPRVLVAARGWHWRTGGGDTTELLIGAYHLCRQVLSAMGAHDLALLVADRAVAATSGQDRPAVLAASAWHMSEALLPLHPAACRDFALATAQFVGQELIDEIALRGALQLVAAKAAATAADSMAADHLLTAAARTAHRLEGAHVACGVAFGPDEIALTRMEIALAAGDFDSVIAVATGLDGAESEPAGRRARYHILVATALAGRGDDVGAVYALVRAAEASPEDVRYDADAVRTLKQLLRDDNRMLRRELERLTELADLGGAR